MGRNSTRISYSSVSSVSGYPSLAEAFQEVQGRLWTKGRPWGWCTEEGSPNRRRALPLE